MAFGTSIREDRIPELIAYANEKLANIDFGTDTIDVDYIFSNADLVKHNAMLMQFAKFDRLYGNGIPQPMFAFELVLQPSNFLVMGKNRDTIKINYGGISFIKFKSAELVESLQYNMQFPLLKVVIIGNAKINEFNGNSSTQIIIREIDIKEMEMGNLI